MTNDFAGITAEDIQNLKSKLNLLIFEYRYVKHIQIGHSMICMLVSKKQG